MWTRRLPARGIPSLPRPHSFAVPARSPARPTAPGLREHAMVFRTDSLGDALPLGSARSSVNWIRDTAALFPAPQRKAHGEKEGRHEPSDSDSRGEKRTDLGKFKAESLPVTNPLVPQAGGEVMKGAVGD